MVDELSSPYITLIYPFITPLKVPPPNLGKLKLSDQRSPAASSSAGRCAAAALAAAGRGMAVNLSKVLVYHRVYIGVVLG